MLSFVHWHLIGQRFLPPAPLPPVGNSWFAHPTGSSAHTGVSPAQAWDLTTAMNGGVAGHLVQPGDTVFLMSGTYGTGVEAFSPTLAGNSSSPITVTSNAGRASINCQTFQPTSACSWVTFQSNPATGAWLEFHRSIANPGDGIDMWVMSTAGDGLKLHHLIVHDAAGVGISPQNETAIQHEVYGCICYNNGADNVLAPTYGHGVYAHGTTTAGATRNVVNCITFDNAGYGFHIFSESGNETNILINNNIAVYNGVGEGYGLIIGSSAQPLVNASASNNISVSPSGNTAASFGYFAGEGGLNTSGYYTNNYIVGLQFVQSWDSGTILNFSNNTCVGSGNQVVKLLYQGPNAVFTPIKVWDNNSYATNQSTFGIFSLDTNGGSNETNFNTIATWRTATGLDAHSTYTLTGDGTLGNKIFLYTSSYNSKVGHLFIHNTGSAATINVDISSVVQNGNTYSILHVYDLFGSAVLTGTYGGGTVAVPLTGTGKTPPPIVGQSGSLVPTNALPIFGVFVVIQTN